MNNTISSNIISEVERAFNTLYVILSQESADPNEPCYQVTSVEFDIIEILRGSLKPHQEAQS
jgi:hypothetical protein